MSIKLSFWVRPSEKTTTNRTPVYLRIQLDSIRTEYSVGESVLLNEWDKAKQKIKGRSESTEAVNGKLSAIRARALKIYNELLLSGEPFNSHTIKDRLVNGISKAITFDELMDEYIEKMKVLSNLYLNGVNIFSGNYANISYSWSNLILGAGFGSNYFNYFNGSIDEVRISNSVRSALDISNYFNSDSPFVADANTIGLWHFDQNTGSTVNGIIGGNGTTNAVWGSGIFGNALLYNGTTSHTDFNFSTPTTNSTIEFWIKPDSIALSWPLMTYGYNSAGLILNPYVSTNTSKITGSSIAYINIFPNPTKDRITIDNGDITKMSGYSIKIFNFIGQQKYQSAINQQQFTIDITQWGGNGLYYLNLIDDSGNIVDVKKILLSDGLNK